MILIDVAELRRIADLIYSNSTRDRNRLETVLTDHGAKAAYDKMVAYLDSAGSRLPAEVMTETYERLGIQVNNCLKLS